MFHLFFQKALKETRDVAQEVVVSEVAEKAWAQWEPTLLDKKVDGGPEFVLIASFCSDLSWLLPKEKQEPALNLQLFSVAFQELRSYLKPFSHPDECADVIGRTPSELEMQELQNQLSFVRSLASKKYVSAHVKAFVVDVTHELHDVQQRINAFGASLVQPLRDATTAKVESLALKIDQCEDLQKWGKCLEDNCLDWDSLKEQAQSSLLQENRQDYDSLVVDLDRAATVYEAKAKEFAVDVDEELVSRVSETIRRCRVIIIYHAIMFGLTDKKLAKDNVKVWQAMKEVAAKLRGWQLKPHEIHETVLQHYKKRLTL